MRESVFSAAAARRRLATRRAILGAGVASLCAGGSAAAIEPGASILFIGNSLTYGNNVPVLLQSVFDSVGVSIEVAMVAKPNFGLQDHWDDRDALREIRRRGWGHVVLQQGPSSRGDSRAQLRHDVRRFSAEIAAIGARPALYSVWPTRDREQDFDRAVESYSLAAADVGGLLFPVGQAWRAALRRNADLELYAADGLHSTVTGSYLAALVMYGVIAGATPVGLPASLRFRDGSTHPVPANLADVLQAAAAEAIEQHPTPPPTL